MPSTETTKSKSKSKTKQSAKEIEEKILRAEEEDDRTFDLNLGFDTDSDPVDRELQEGDDIFLYGGEYLFKKEKVFPKFTIKKYGQLLTTKMHPYSLDKLQKEFGGGSYTIFCKKPNGQIFKQQSIEIADPTPDLSKTESDSTVGLVDTAKATPNTMELLTFLNTMNQQAEIKARDARESAGSSSAQTMQLMTTMMQSMIQMQTSASEKSQTLFMEMNKMHNQSMEKMSENMNRVFEKINDQIHSLAGKKEEITPLKLLELMQRSEEKALKNQEMVMKMVEERAEAMRPEPAEEESLMKSMIKGFLPIVAQAVKQQSETTPQQAVDPVLVQRQREYELHQRKNAEIAAQNAKIQQQPVRRVEGSPTTAVGSGTPHRGTPQNEGKTVSPRPASPSSTPPTQKTSPNAGPSNGSGNQGHETSAQVVNGKDHFTKEYKENMVGLVLQEIADGVMGGVQPGEVALTVKKKLETSKVQVKHFVQVIREEDLLAIQKEYKLPEDLLPWLTELHKALRGMSHANLEAKTGTNVGEPAKNSTVQVV